MNKKQQVALWGGIFVIVLVGLLPPWNMDVYDGGTARFFAERGLRYSGDDEVWYRFAFADPEGSRRDSSVTNMFDANNDIRPSEDWRYAPHTVRWQGEINVVRLLIQWVIVAAITVGAVLSLKDK